MFNPGGEGERLFDVGMVLRSSLTGWGAGDALGSVSIEAGIEIGDRQHVTFDLSGVSALQNVTTPVTVRFYMNTNGENTSPFFYVDDIAVEGTTTVPEPASTGLLALGGAGLLLRRYRRAA